MTLTEAQDLVAAHAPWGGYADTYRALENEYLPHVCAALQHLPPGKAVEVGPGWGTMATWLAGNGWRVTVCDRRPLGAYITGTLLDAAGFAYVHGDIFVEPLEKRADLLLMTQVLPHLKYRPDQAMRNCRAMMKRGGLLLVSAINHEVAPLQAAYGTRWQDVPTWDSGPPGDESVTVMYTPATLRELLETSFAVKRVWQPEHSATMLATATAV
jgi:SAM-dependent methyltransferase